MAVKIPVVTGDGRRIELDSDDYGRLVVLPEVCSEIDPRLWEMFAQADQKPSATGRTLRKTVR